jgi:aromatic ring-cleaving dioxygenase
VKIVAIYPEAGPPQAPSMSTDYHFHLYFEASGRESAAALRARLEAQPGFSVQTSALRDGPFGPHPLAQFRATVPASALEAALRWYMFNHDQHVVLIHPLSGDDLLDHTRHALWLGHPLVLDTSRL